MISLLSRSLSSYGIVGNMFFPRCCFFGLRLVYEGVPRERKPDTSPSLSVIRLSQSI